jgi:hypothetical protein
MSGNYVGFGNYADAEELATNDDALEAAEVEAEDGQDTRLAGIIVHE